MASPVAELEVIGASPVGHTNLTAGMLAVVPVMALGAVFFLLGAPTCPPTRTAPRRRGAAEAVFVATEHRPGT